MSIWTRVRNVFRSERLNREIAEEIESHLAEAVAAGRDPGEARRAFGSMAREQEASHHARVVGWMDSLRADVSFGWGQLLKRKVTTAAAVLSLGLAIGACTSAFRLVDALFLRPLPVSHPERLYAIQYRSIDRMGKPSTQDISFYPEFVQMREAARGDAELVAISTPYDGQVTFGSETEKAHQQFVSGSMFSTFGLQPAAGRLFTGDDDRVPKAAPVAVLSYGYWTARFGQDPKMVGRTFRMNDTVYQIVGVAPKGFRGTGPGVMTDIFVPTMMNELVSEPDANWFQILVSVKPGVAIEPLVSKIGAADHLSRVQSARRVLKLDPNIPKALIEGFLSPKVELRRTTSGVSSLQKDYGGPLLVLGVLVGMVLLIACVNVANLVSAQGASRAREMAVRVSLGAGRGRLVRLVMVESAMVGVAAAALGMLFAWWATPFVVSRIHPANTPLPLAIGPDWMVMAFGTALTVGVTVLSGLFSGTAGLGGATRKRAEGRRGAAYWNSLDAGNNRGAGGVLLHGAVRGRAVREYPGAADPAVDRLFSRAPVGGEWGIHAAGAALEVGADGEAVRADPWSGERVAGIVAPAQRTNDDPLHFSQQRDLEEPDGVFSEGFSGMAEDDADSAAKWARPARAG